MLASHGHTKQKEKRVKKKSIQETIISERGEVFRAACTGRLLSQSSQGNEMVRQGLHFAFNRIQYDKYNGRVGGKGYLCKGCHLVSCK